MDKKFKILTELPINPDTMVIINFINDTSENKFGSFNIDQDLCHDKLKKLMRHLNSRYTEDRYYLFKLRDLYMKIQLDKNNNKTSKKCFKREFKETMVNDNLLITIKNDRKLEENAVPLLLEYHQSVFRKDRIIEYEGIEAIFVEERNPDSTENFIELRFINKDKNTIRKVLEIMSALEQ